MRCEREIYVECVDCGRCRQRIDFPCIMDRKMECDRCDACRVEESE